MKLTHMLVIRRMFHEVNEHVLFPLQTAICKKSRVYIECIRSKLNRGTVAQFGR